MHCADILEIFLVLALLILQIQGSVTPGLNEASNWYGSEPRELYLAENTSSSEFSKTVYAGFHAVPATSVPLTIGFRTKDTVGSSVYSTTPKVMLEVAAASGFDFSTFEVANVLDLTYLPDVSYAVVTSTKLQLIFAPGASLSSGTDYEATLLVSTAGAGTTVSEIAVSWYTYDVDETTWVQQENGLANKERFHAEPNLDGYLISPTLRTSARSMSGTEVVSMWMSNSQVLVVMLDLYMDAASADGIVSILPTPVSLWNLESLGAGIVDGSSCPDGSLNGVQGVVVGVRFPTNAGPCYMRRRGQHLNSIDLDVTGVDMTSGLLVKLYLPSPAAGSFDTWFVGFRENGANPGYLMTTLPFSIELAMKYFAPEIGARIDAFTSDSPGRPSEIDVSYRVGANLRALTNSRVEISIDSSVFSLDIGGCAFGSSKPFGAQVLTSRGDNACVMTWMPDATEALGTVQISADGEVDGNGVDFHSLGIVGYKDTPTVHGSAYHHLLAGDDYYIVQRRTVASAANIVASVIAASSNNLLGTGTLFSTGGFDERLEVGDSVNIAGRTFVVVVINSDVDCDVTEGGVAPASGIANDEFSVTWKSRLRVVGLLGVNSSLTEAAAGTSFSILTTRNGAAFWNRQYSLRISGRNEETNASYTSALPTIRVSSGRDADSDSYLDFWEKRFEGNPYTVRGFSPTSLVASLHPSTVTAGVTARCVLQFRTWRSTAYTRKLPGSSDAGMLLRLQTPDGTKIQVRNSDGTSLDAGTVEQQRADCSTLLLEVRAESPHGFPHPRSCWWDSWSGHRFPSAYVRFFPGNGLRAVTTYELVFMAEIETTANLVEDLLHVEVIDGSDTTIGFGHAALSRTMVPQSTEGLANQPALGSVQIVGSSFVSRRSGSLTVQFQSTQHASSHVTPNSLVRVILYPLLSWNLTSCSALRSDGGRVTCEIERIGRQSNVVALASDPNAQDIGPDSAVLFTISYVLQSLPSGFFQQPIAAEVWNHLRETKQYWASHLTSADTALSGYNFQSLPIVAGNGEVVSHSKSTVKATGNKVLLLFKFAAKCTSTATMPCQLEVQVPAGFSAVSAASPDLGSVIAGSEGKRYSPFPTSGVNCGSAAACNVDVKIGAALYNDCTYGLLVTVTNPPVSLAKDAVGNVWKMTQSGGSSWNLGTRQTAPTFTLDVQSSFAVVGQLQQATVQVSNLQCGAPAFLRVQFVATQRVPAGGVVRVVAPKPYEFESASGRCFASGRVSWPQEVVCNIVAVENRIAEVTLGSTLVGKGSFHSFDLRVRTPPWSQIVEDVSGLFFTIVTYVSAELALEAAEQVSWSALLDADGAPAFREPLSCWHRSFLSATIDIKDGLPYEVIGEPTIAVLTFSLDDVGIPDVGLDVRVLAPAGFQWDLGEDLSEFNTSGAIDKGAVAAPMIASPVDTVATTTGTANELRLRSTAALEPRTLYGMSAPIRIPSAPAGSAQNSGSGPFWHLIASTGNPRNRKIAARLVETYPPVRAISAFSLRRVSAVPSAITTISLAFQTATFLPNLGWLVLELPSGFNFDGAEEACHATPSIDHIAIDSNARTIPSDAVVRCITSPDVEVPSVTWQFGMSGLDVGLYTAAATVVNPGPGVSMTDARCNLRTFTDLNRVRIADAAASLPLEEPTIGLRQAELVLTVVNPAAQIMDSRRSRNNWVTFAFELAAEIPPKFEVIVKAPDGFKIPENCSVHVGDGVNFTPLGVSSKSLPSHVTQYKLLPPGTGATCTGFGSMAAIDIFPVLAGSRSSLPAAPGKMYLFRLQVVNPSRTPSVNEWYLRVDNQELSGIPGFRLHEMREVSLATTNTAAGDMADVTVRFWTKSPVPEQEGLRHGVLKLVMPKGFKLVLSDLGDACHGFALTLAKSAGVSEPSKVFDGEFTCEQEDGVPNALVVHLRLDSPMVSARYELQLKVWNPPLPIAQLPWEFRSYRSDLAQEAEELDSATVAGYTVNPKLEAFTVIPSPGGQQNSGTSVTLRFATRLNNNILSGDILSIACPENYVFNCDTTKFQSALLPRPSCDRHRALFSFVGMVDHSLPAISPAGAANAATLTFDLVVVYPAMKPTINTIELAHCRGVTDDANDVLNGSWAVCPTGTQVVASRKRLLWPIVPKVQDLTVLLGPGLKVSAAAQVSNVLLRFAITSEGITKIRVFCHGMDFTTCTASISGSEPACSGTANSAVITIPGPRGGNLLPLPMFANQLAEVQIRTVVNPAVPGLTTWRVTTLGPNTSGNDEIYDESEWKSGPNILKYLFLEPVKHCDPQVLRRNQNGKQTSPWYETCTARAPWYGQRGNSVILRFQGFQGGEVMRGHKILIQPPSGFRFAGGQIAKPLTWVAGLGEVANMEQTVVSVDTLPLKEAMPQLAKDVLLLRVSSGEPLTNPFALELTVDNSVLDPEVNLWRVMLLDPDGLPVYTNDGNWPGFELRGTFLSGGETSLKSLITEFPSERNVVRLKLALASPLAGLRLQMRVVAPSGFAFDADCLPDHPNPLPVVANSALPWLSACRAVVSDPRVAVIHIPNVATSGGLLEAGETYATNLRVTNAENYDPSNPSFWEVFTYKSGGNSRFVHYTALQTFQLEIMRADVIPEMPKFQVSSMLHVVLRPARDLGPHGQLLIRAPEAYVLFCELVPYFLKGNLPDGASCTGANNHATVQLSDGEALESNVSYQFAIRVTNPASSSGAVDETGWAIKLQTTDRRQFETSKVAGYAPTFRAVSRFNVNVRGSHGRSAPTSLRIAFKLETVLARADYNLLKLTAPDGFSFECARTLGRNGFVLPSAAIKPAGLEDFADMVDKLEPAASRRMQNYRNDGTTEDGRAIVDCSKKGVLGLVVDFTESASFGRYAFQVQAINAAENPHMNIWALHSYTAGILNEEGACGGYEVTDSAGLSGLHDVDGQWSSSGGTAGGQSSSLGHKVASTNFIGYLCVLWAVATCW